MAPHLARRSTLCSRFLSFSFLFLFRFGELGATVDKQPTTRYAAATRKKKTNVPPSTTGFFCLKFTSSWFVCRISFFVCVEPPMWTWWGPERDFNISFRFWGVWEWKRPKRRAAVDEVLSFLVLPFGCRRRCCCCCCSSSSSSFFPFRRFPLSLSLCLFFFFFFFFSFFLFFFLAGFGSFFFCFFWRIWKVNRLDRGSSA